MTKNSIEMTNETQKVDFINSTPYKIGQRN